MLTVTFTGAWQIEFFAKLAIIAILASEALLRENKKSSNRMLPQ